MDKKHVLCLVTLLSVSSLYAASRDCQMTTRCEKCDKQDEEEVAVVLSNFAGMVASFINMTSNPNDTRVVGQNLGNIIHGIGNIVSVAIKAGETIEEYVQSQDFREKVMRLVLSIKN